MSPLRNIFFATKAQRHEEFNYYNTVNEYNKKLSALESSWHNLIIVF
jgi:hypothetical protein